MTRRALRHLVAWLDYHLGCDPPDVVTMTPTTHDRRRYHG